MAPRRNAREGTPSVAAPAARPSSAEPSQVARVAQSSLQNAQETFVTLKNHYIKNTEPRIKQVDAFLAFLMVNGGIQFLYCLLFGTYPFNAFLAGFGVCVGMFVLTVSLRMQLVDILHAEFPEMSQERAFAEYLACSFALQFFCINFIN